MCISPLTVSLVNERCTKVEGQAVRAVNDEEEERQTGAMPDRRLEVDRATLVYTHVVQVREDTLSAERLRGTDGRDDLLGQTTTLGNVLERDLHVGRDELVHDSTRDGNAGKDRRHREGEAPRADIGKHETRNERGKEIHAKRDLLGNTLLYQIYKGSSGYTWEKGAEASTYECRFGYV